MIPLRNAIGVSESKLSVGEIWELCGMSPYMCVFNMVALFVLSLVVDNKSYPIKPGKVVISPDPPKKGENVNVNAEFTSS